MILLHTGNVHILEVNLITSETSQYIIFKSLNVGLNAVDSHSRSRDFQ